MYRKYECLKAQGSARKAKAFPFVYRFYLYNKHSDDREIASFEKCQNLSSVLLTNEHGLSSKHKHEFDNHTFLQILLNHQGNVDNLPQHKNRVRDYFHVE